MRSGATQVRRELGVVDHVEALGEDPIACESAEVGETEVDQRDDLEQLRVGFDQCVEPLVHKPLEGGRGRLEFS